jgi:hypothetical protein
MQAPIANQNNNDNMKIIDHMKRPVSLAVLTVLVICLSPLIAQAQMPSQDTPILAVLRAQHAARIDCTSFAYAQRIARIDATACPDDFFHAWQKYVLAVQRFSAVRNADAGRLILFGGAALLSKSWAPMSDAIPEHPEELEIVRNTALADWQNVKHVALRYGIRIAPIKSRA